MEEEYWYCVIGPTQSSKVAFGADYPLKMAVEETFYKLVGGNITTCNSGWGVTEDQARQISFAADGDDLKKALIKSYHDEDKPVPRHMRAWELLFNEETENEKV